MKEEEILSLVSKEYDLKCDRIEKIKNVYKIIGDEDDYCLKVIKYEYSHFIFILSAINHLQNRGFKTTPEIISNINGVKFIKFDNKYAYLTKWILGRESNYDNPIELENATIKLAELHKKSEGFNITKEMKPRIGWFSWIKVFSTRRNEILDFQNRIYQKAYKDEFDKFYLSYIDEEIDRANRAIEGLKKSNYYEYMDKQVYRRGFCHHDYANHNIIIDKNYNMNIIDFDYCILDTPIHDLSSLLIRSMKNRRWDVDKGKKIINAYNNVNPLEPGYLSIMKEFIRFPQAFWQIGLQKYWEQQPWDKELFLSKISKYVEDRNDKEEFIDNFSEEG